MLRLLFMLCVLGAGSLCVAGPDVAAPLPATLFLTWQGDPSTTMTVQWLAHDGSGVEVHWAATGSGQWQSEETTAHDFGPSSLKVLRAQLTGLVPDREYHLCVSDTSYRFRTAPATLERPLRFVSGGDAGATPATLATCLEAARQDPLFALIGGDIAYANGARPERWVEFLSIWHRAMVTADGRLIPMVVTIGNHDVDKRKGVSREAAPFFYSLFGLFDDHGYACLDFGDYLSLVLLDSGHTEPIAGAQKEWLDRALRSRQRVPHLLAAYHIPAYPSFRPFDGAASAEIRRHWVPLLERYGVDVVFENHEHTYKRTPPLSGGKASEGGVVFLGDGAWGVDTRRAKPADQHWYLDVTAAENHFLVTELAGEQRSHRAINNRGWVFDCYPPPPIAIRVLTPPVRLRGREIYPSDQALAVEVQARSPGTGPEVRHVGDLWGEGRSGWRRRLTSFSLAGAEAARCWIRGLLPGRCTLSVEGQSLRGSRPVPFAIRGQLVLQVFDATSLRAMERSVVGPGLSYRVYEGSWRELPDFRVLTAARAGEAHCFDPASISGKTPRYGIVFEGHLSVPEDGIYCLSTASADGSRLLVGDRLVVDNDARHDLREARGWVVLERGDHPFRLEYFFARGMPSLAASIEGPGLSKTPLENVIQQLSRH